MQLQVPPKEALTALRKLIKDGHEAVDWIEEDYGKLPQILEIYERDSMQKFRKKQEEKNRKAEERKKQEEKDRKKREKEEKRKNEKFLEAVKKNTSISDTVRNATLLVEQEAERNRENFKKLGQMASKVVEQVQQSPSFTNFLQDNSPKLEDGSWSIDKKDEFYKVAVNNYVEKRKEWGTEVMKILKEISGDYVRINQYREASGMQYIEPVNPIHPYLSERSVDEKFKDFVDIKRNFEAKIKFLEEMYLEIEKKVDDHLFYISETNKLCYFNRVIELKSSSNQAVFCEFMFGFAIGEKKSFAEIFAYMEGMREDDILKIDRQRAINAMNEVNIKTKKMFGFPIFHKDQQTVYICPSS